MSRAHFQNPDFFSAYQEILDRHELPAGLVEIELTESIMFSDTEILKALGIINRIHAAGLLCSLDDFGSGYSALGLLQKLPIDTLKLDRGFFLDCRENPRAYAVIESIIELAHKLDVSTVAEGVEEKEQVDGCARLAATSSRGITSRLPFRFAEFEAENTFSSNNRAQPNGRALTCFFLI